MPLKINNNPYKLGNVPKGVAKSFSVDVANEGALNIIVEDVHPGCGACTAASMTRMFVRSKETSKLNITFKSNGTGQDMNKTVTIKYMEDNIQHNLVFTFIVTVI